MEQDNNTSLITFPVYQHLSQVTRIQLLWLHGVSLQLSRIKKEVQIDLYALADFYVELYYDRKTMEPLYIKSFRDLKRLDPFLSQVDISGLAGARDQHLFP